MFFQRLEFQFRIEHQRDIARKERHDALEQMEHIMKETYDKTQKEKVEEMQGVAKESEQLKKQMEKMKLDLDSNKPFYVKNFLVFIMYQLNMQEPQSNAFFLY